MAVSRDDVRRIAALARLGVADDRIDAIAAELNGILGHIDALRRADASSLADASGTAAGMPLREDVPASDPLVAPRESFAPAMRDGFFLVPRLATHDDAESGA